MHHVTRRSDWDTVSQEECRWEEAQEKCDCSQCEAAYEQWCDMLADMDREERAFG